MKSKAIIIFIFLLIAGAAVVGLDKAGVFKSSTKQPIETVDQHLFIPTPKSPKELTIEDMSGKKLVFIKSDADGWDITHPIHGPVKPGAVEKIVSTLVNLQYARRFDPLGTDGLDDTQTRLDKPGWIVSLYDDAGNTYMLFVGRQCPQVGASVRQIETYVRVKGFQETGVVAEDLSALLCKDPEDFHRRKDLEPQHNAEIISLPGSVLDYTLPQSETSHQDNAASKSGATTKDSK